MVQRENWWREKGRDLKGGWWWWRTEREKGDRILIWGFWRGGELAAREAEP